MEYPEHYSIIKTGRLSLQNWLIKNYPDFYKYLSDKYANIDIKAALYMFYNGIDNIPLCEECGKPVKFHGYIYGFSKFCCPTCAGKNEEVQNKLKQSLISNHGENYKEQIIKKIADTKQKKYGDSKYNNLAKSKQTCLEKYGVDNPMKNDLIKEKSKQTCLEKYGNEYYFASEAFLKNKNGYVEKTKQTCLEKYGGLNCMSNPIVKNKVKQTCLEKYGVEWNCMRPDAKNSRNFNSVPNESFANLLNQYNIEYEREYHLNGKSYDFKVDNYLIEINPSPTHNINWNPYGGKLMNKDYHLEKTELAKHNGYNVINVWDWDDMDKILYLIYKKESIYARNCILKEIKAKECNDFLNKYHLQNTCKGQSVKIGLYYNDILVSVMTFGKPRYNKKYEWELLRLCFHKDYKIVGGSEKMFKYFISNYNPNSIISYCDNSKFNGDVYDKLGFILNTKKITPSRHWYNYKTHMHITDNLLRQKGYDKLFNTNYGKGTDNHDLMIKNNFIEIYDAGQLTYEWKKCRK